MDYHAVYRSNAEQYQQLVGAEDVDGNLAEALDALIGFGGLDVVEVGAGTGRVTRLLADAGATVTATEPAPAMMGVAVELAARGAAEPADRTGSDGATGSVRFCRAEAAALPFPDGRFDAAVAGWVFAHQREWSPNSWQDVVTGFVDETRRVVADGGPIVLIETLGTGQETPNPPADLVEYYAWLEATLSFTRTEIRTDYQFASVDEAAVITGGFFGQDFAETVRRNGWARVPECTGVWVTR
ncbi:MAG: class I SAM-dependent methyltransferase [Actinomycetota bacterium]